MSQDKTEIIFQNISSPIITHKKQRTGRWTTHQSYIFQSLLQRYGKNWKKIHQYMKGRTLSQIRSHGQKYFDKIGTQRVEQLTRRAKLLEAFQTLQRQKRYGEALKVAELQKKHQCVIETIKEQQSPITEVISQELKVLVQMNKQSEIIKEQEDKIQIVQKQISNNIIEDKDRCYTTNEGFLISLMRSNPQLYVHYGIYNPNVNYFL